MCTYTYSTYTPDIETIWSSLIFTDNIWSYIDSFGILIIAAQTTWLYFYVHICDFDRRSSLDL